MGQRAFYFSYEKKLWQECMQEDFCRKEGELASMNTTLKRISKIVEGNGQPGLDKQMAQLNIVIPELQKSVSGLTDKVQQLPCQPDHGQIMANNGNPWNIGQRILPTPTAHTFSLSPRRSMPNVAISISEHPHPRAAVRPLRPGPTIHRPSASLLPSATG